MPGQDIAGRQWRLKDIWNCRCARVSCARMAERSESFTVQRSLPGERFDTFLRTRYPAVSRGTIQRLIEEGHIQVNGRPVKATHTPRAGEDVSVCWPEPKPTHTEPEAIPLDILYEDNDLLVLNKAPGMVVHPGPGNEEHTLVNALVHHCAGQLSGIAGVARPGIVHRLDKETSGCLVVAKNDPAHLGLSAQFAARTTLKIYQAIVCGVIPRDAGTIRTAIARHKTQRQRMAVVDEDEGREAITSYQVRQRLNAATLVEARIHTGRTHQIRVHFQYLGHPVAGDLTYGKNQNARLEEATDFRAPRVLLHAGRLEFMHPCAQEPMKFTAPLPADFEAAIAALKIAAGDQPR
jgi:23S rRNA pseudouridine1911/1915/1917 synthase